MFEQLLARKNSHFAETREWLSDIIRFGRHNLKKINIRRFVIPIIPKVFPNNFARFCSFSGNYHRYDFEIPIIPKVFPKTQEFSALHKSENRLKMG